MTTNHPFYVDSGPGIVTSAWVHAGDLRVGDRIRTESGQDVTVVGLRYHAGQALVYTLTVATDHDFFVGSAGVLVHNCPIDVDDPNLGELLSKGVHVHMSGVLKQGDVELNVGVNATGDVVFSGTFSYYTDKQVQDATEIAEAGLQDPKIVNDLIKAAQHAEALAKGSNNSRMRAKAAEFAALVKALQ